MPGADVPFLLGDGFDSEHRVVRGDPFELFERGLGIHWDMCPGPWRKLQVALQDRCSVFRAHFHEVHGFAATVVKDRLPLGRSYVGHPVRALPEHRDEIAAASVVSDHDRKRSEATGAAATHL